MVKSTKPIILLFSLFSFLFASGQGYAPFVKENAVWKNNMWWWAGYGNVFDFSSYALFIDDDTLVNGIKYKFLYRDSYDSLGMWKNKNRAELIREDSAGKVFVIPRNSKDSLCSEELLLYDFGIQIGDTVGYKYSQSSNGCFLGSGYIPDTHILVSIDSTYINGVIRKVFIFNTIEFGSINMQDPRRDWIEGIGNLYFGFYGPFWTAFEGNEYLGCYYDSSIYWALDSVKGCKYVGIEENKQSMQAETSIYPNPSSDYIHVSTSNRNLNFALYNLDGKVALNGKLVNDKIDISFLPKGIYFLKLLDNEKQVGSFKVVKQ